MTGVRKSTDVYKRTVKGDNLGVNGICEFVESFVGNHYCRHCKLHKDDTWYKTVEMPNYIRTEEDYEVDVATNNPTETGVKAACLLNEVDNFHVAKNFAPDIMHDLLEGICALEVYLVLGVLIKEGYFTLDLLNSRITSFDYGLQQAKNKTGQSRWPYPANSSTNMVSGPSYSSPYR